jgi:hypothetical protein
VGPVDVLEILSDTELLASVDLVHELEQLVELGSVVQM